MLCNEAIKYQSTIHIHFREAMSNAKSVLSVLGSCIKSGDEVEFICEGPDEEQALQAIIQLVESGLGE